ncbi:MAG: Flp family type IVb pilin [Dehalococcoidia bacterium]|nr:Flp family type IVb pilin [Dehalococcoidia bacterium]
MTQRLLRLLARAQAATQQDHGQGLAEYGLILGLVAALCVAALGVLQGSVSSALNQAANAL